MTSHVCVRSIRWWPIPALVAFATSCTSPIDPSYLAEPPALVGEIVARDVVTPTSGDSPTVHVKDPPDEECGVIFEVRESTTLVERSGASAFRRVGLAQLKRGARVAVWATGVLDSCPGQSVAQAIEVLYG